MKLKNKKTGETFEGEIWFAKIKDGSRELAYEIKSKEDLDNFEIYTPEEIKPFEEVAKVKETVTLGVGTHEDYKENQIQVANIDYYEVLPDGTKKTEFTWGEAMEIEDKTHGKWRVPTVPEWFAICAAFGRSEDGTDADPQVLREKLGLTVDEDGYGNYWSAGSYSAASSYGLYFGSTGLGPRCGNGKGNGFAVRCVAAAE